MNLQGTINTILRRAEPDGVRHTYKVKGNALTSLSTTKTSQATFTGKASIQDVTDQANPISVDSNATFQITKTDKGEPGRNDSIGITIRNKAGTLWFASNWNKVAGSVIAKECCEE